MGKRFVLGSERVNLSSNRYKPRGMFTLFGLLFVLGCCRCQYE